MKTIRILDLSSDRAIAFDDTDASASARAKAEQLFERLRRGNRRSSRVAVTSPCKSPDGEAS